MWLNNLCRVYLSSMARNTKKPTLLRFKSDACQTKIRLSTLMPQHFEILLRWHLSIKLMEKRSSSTLRMASV